MKTWIAGGIGLLIGAAAAVGALLVMSDRGTPVSGRPFDPASPTFPKVTGDNLNRRAISFPEGMDAPYSLLLVAFFQRQQPEVNTWLPTAASIAADHANVEYYELPTIASEWANARGWVDGGMRSGIPDFSARERTVTIYTDTAKFRELAGIDSSDRIWAGLVDREGRVYWSARGPMTPAMEAELRRVVKEVASPNAD